MKTEILLNKTFEKIVCDGCIIHCSGHIYIDQKIRTGNEFGQYLKERIENHSINSFIELVTGFCGSFAIFIEKEDQCWGVVDRIRSIPIVYAEDGDRFYIGSSAHEIAERVHGARMEESLLKQYLLMGFVLGNETLYSGVYSLCAGELLTKKQNSLEIRNYFEFLPVADEHQFAGDVGQMDKMFLEVFRDMVAGLSKGGRFVVPLSGGYDSRLVVSYLSRLKVKEVLCYTFGIEGPEAELSRRTAERLGYEWHFIEYELSEIRTDQDSEQYKSFMRFAGGGISRGIRQDYWAIQSMRESGVLKKDDVFVPGHALDFIAGSHIQWDQVKLNSPSNGITRDLIEKHFLFNIEENLIGSVGDNIQSYVEKKDNEGCSYEQIVECFNWEERQAKYIANHVRTYEWFGYKWRLPYWDRRCIEYWMHTNFEQRKRRNFFILAAEQTLLTEEVVGMGLATVRETLCAKILRRGLKALNKHFETKIKLRKKHIIGMDQWMPMHSGNVPKSFQGYLKREYIERGYLIPHWMNQLFDSLKNSNVSQLHSVGLGAIHDIIANYLIIRSTEHTTDNFR